MCLQVHHHMYNLLSCPDQIAINCQTKMHLYFSQTAVIMCIFWNLYALWVHQMIFHVISCACHHLHNSIIPFSIVFLNRPHFMEIHKYTFNYIANFLFCHNFWKYVIFVILFHFDHDVIWRKKKHIFHPRHVIIYANDLLCNE